MLLHHEIGVPRASTHFKRQGTTAPPSASGLLQLSPAPPHVGHHVHASTHTAAATVDSLAITGVRLVLHLLYSPVPVRLLHIPIYQ